MNLTLFKLLMLCIIKGLEVMKTIKNTTRRFRPVLDFFQRQRLFPFESVFGFFCIYSGLAGLLQFGVSSEAVTNVLGPVLATVFNILFLLAGAGIYFGTGWNKPHLEASGLNIVVAALLIRSITLGWLVGINATVINAYVLNIAFIVACVVRLFNIHKLGRLPLQIKLIPIDALVVANNEGNIAFWPESARSLFGYTEEEIVGQHVTTLIPERYRESFHEKFMELTVGKTTWLNKPLNLVAITKTGEEFAARMIVRKWGKQSTTYYIATIRNDEMWSGIDDLLRGLQLG